MYVLPLNTLPGCDIDKKNQFIFLSCFEIARKMGVTKCNKCEDSRFRRKNDQTGRDTI